MSTTCGCVTAADVQDYTKAEGKIKNMPNFILPILKLVYLSTWDKLLLPHVQLEAEELHRITPRALEQSVSLLEHRAGIFDQSK